MIYVGYLEVSLALFSFPGADPDRFRVTHTEVFCSLMFNNSLQGACNKVTLQMEAAEPRLEAAPGLGVLHNHVVYEVSQQL